MDVRTGGATRERRPQPVHLPDVGLSAQPHLQTPDVPAGQPQPLSLLELLQMTSFNFV